MRILLVNGSPRRAAANSRIVLDALRRRLGESHAYRVVDAMTAEGARPEDLDVDVIVLAFPLYIDSLHARLLSWLLSFEALLRATAPAIGGERRIGMVAVANNGFHEGVQNKTALDIVAHFCARCGIEWRGGVGIGTGEMLGNLKDALDEMPIKRPVSRALDAIAARVVDGQGAGDNLYVQHALPWPVYRLMGHIGWRTQARKHGVGRQQLKSRPIARRPHGT
jgi:hypothetical protein